MGHCIEIITTDLDLRNSTSMSSFKDELEKWTKWNCNPYECEGGYRPNVNLDMREVYASYKDACKFLDGCSSDPFCYRAVPYRGYAQGDKQNKPNARQEALQKKIDAVKENIKALNQESLPVNFKAELVTCKNCHSKINFKQGNNSIKNSYKCPVCGTDMRSATTLKKLEGYQMKIESIKEDILKEERKKLQKAPIRWAVLCDVHC